MEAAFSWLGLGTLLITASFLTKTEAQLNLQDPIVQQIIAILRLYLNNNKAGGTSSHGGGYSVSDARGITPQSYSSYHPTPQPYVGVDRETAGQGTPRERPAHHHTIASSTGQQGRQAKVQPDPCPQYVLDMECHCLPECTYMIGFEETSSCGLTAEFVRCCPSHLAGRCW
ncbi:hypothetical protein ACJMK2_007991 [Sinanodonta woodiana]|uniref:Uncharacterized protein n=1 Tax=Sinanodonta woodiana TaxID=1069815 RepID=A0ABD3VNF3_SINWO